MAETPRFSVYGSDIIDTSTGKVLTPNEFNQRSTPEERGAIIRDLTARSLMANQESENQIDEDSVDEDLAQSAQSAQPTQSAQSSESPEDSDVPTLTIKNGKPPSLDEFLDVTRPLNPDFDDRELAIEYHKVFPDAAKHYPPPPMDEWIGKVKGANPDFEEGEIKQAYLDIYGPPKVEEHGDVARGFIESLKQVPQLGYGLLAGAGATGEKLFGEGGGSTALKKFGVENYQRISEDIAKDTKLSDSFNYSYDRAKEGDYDALVDWLQHGFGYVGGQAMQLLATGVAGGLVGKAALKPVAERVAGGLVQKEAARLAAQEGVTLAGAELSKQAVANIAARMGQTLAVGATAFGAEGGEIFGELTTEAEQQGRQLSGAELAKAGVMTSFAGLLEFAGDKIGLDLLLGKSPISRMLGVGHGVGGRILKGVETGAIAAVPEAATEFGQTVAEEWGKGHDPVGTVGPETLRQAQDAAAIGALGGTVVGGIGGAMGSAPPDERKIEKSFVGAPESVSTDTIAPIMTAKTIDEAIRTTASVVESSPISSTQLDQAIAPTVTSAVDTYSDSHKSADQVAFERLLQATGPLEKTEGGTSFRGSPVQIVDPRTLPEQTAPDAGMSKEKYEALSVMAQAFGKRLVIFKEGPSLPNGAFWIGKDPSRMYLADTTKGEDHFVVLAHEAMHTMQGTSFYDAFKQTIYEQRTPQSRAVIAARHGELSDSMALEEMAADIGSTELQKPELWGRVFAHLREKVGDEQAKVEVNSFIDSLKQIIQRIKSLISTRSITVQGKTLTELYVNDLEKVHDSLVQAVGETLYNRRFKTPEQAQQIGKLTLSKRPVEGRAILPKDVQETFAAIASTQREKPEKAMLAVQAATGGGLLSHAVEHAGDLIHRMTEGAKWGTPGSPYVREKVNRLLTSLTHAYGFEKEHAENLANNKADQAAVSAALKAYVAEHRAIPVYNRAQWLARAVAVAVGEMRVKDAIAHLKDLQKLVESRDFGTHAFEFSRATDKSLRPYLQPIPGKLIGRQIINSPTMPDFDLFNIDVDIPGHPSGSTVTQETMASKGYRIVPTDVIDKEDLPTKSPQVDDRETPESRTTLSTTVPSSKRSTNDAYTQKWVIGTDDIRASRAHVNALVAVIKKYSMMSGKGSRESVIAEFRGKVVDNLLWLYDLVPADVRDRAKRWYDGANRIASEWAEQDGYSKNQHAGVLAVLSPQKDWFMNVSLADRIRTIVKTRADFPWNERMTAWATSFRSNAKSDEERAAADLFVDASSRLSGMTLAEMSVVDAALFVRAYDQTYHERAYRAVTPEGGFTDYVVNKNEQSRDLFGDVPGVRGTVAWGNQRTIQKAVSILRDGSNKNISENLGKEHKVRNFYNNILDPNSKEGHVTIDTHAMAAAIMKALSGNSPEVMHLFGRAGSNAETGASGAYALVADAYRDAAAARQVLPRELQSVVWEAVRGLFPRSVKKVLAPKIEAVWAAVRKGTMTIGEARREIFRLSGGVNKFAWEDGGHGLSPANGGRSFDSKEVPRATFAPATEGLQQPGGIRGGERVLPEPYRPYQGPGKAGRTLDGLPRIVKVDGRDVEFLGFKPAQDAARAYMKKAGLPYHPETAYHKLDPARSTRIAESFDRMAHTPHDPEVKAAYRAMINETLAQYETIRETGLVVEFISGKDPYGNPRNAILDVVENNHLYVFSTREGFGSDASFDPTDNPLLEETPYLFSGKPTLVNDIFRLVHDYFGHIKDGVGFRAEGEDNAWRSHAAMFSDQARRAMTTETRGQNSWVNYGPHGVTNRTASPSETVYADQKIGLLPDWVMERGDATPTLSPKVNDPDVLKKLTAALPSTTSPSLTKFLLPDGTRLTWPKSMASQNAHYELAKRAGVWLGEVVRDGAVRYVPFVGVEVGTGLTTKQAETIIDDWYRYEDTLQIDVVDKLGSIMISHNFDVLNQEITPSFLQDWVAFSLEKGDQPTLNPGGTADLVHYSQQKGLTTISPKYHGTGQAGAERIRQMNEGKDYLPRVFFYRAGTKIEPRFKGLTKYRARVPESSLVDLATLKGSPTERERAAKKAGYKGYYNSDSSMPNVVALFEPVQTGQGEDVNRPTFAPNMWKDLTPTSREYNSNNAWGFAGSIGIQYDFGKGVSAKVGTAYVRHGDPVKFITVSKGSRRLFDKTDTKSNRELAYQKVKELLAEQTLPASEYDGDVNRPTFAPNVWFSGLGRLLEQKMPNKADATQVRNIASAAKPEEVQWVGLEEFLKTKESFTKAEVLDFVHQNQVQIEELEKGGTPKTTTAYQLWDVTGQPYAQGDETAARRWRAEGQDVHEVQVAYDRDRGSSDTKFSTYQLPGGENYRELLLTLPEVTAEDLARQKELRAKPVDTLTQQERDILSNIARGRGASGGRGLFTSSHWSEPNVLAHIRMNDRTGPNGEKVLFLEEIQSDWHQKGKRVGYMPRGAARGTFKAKPAYRDGRQTDFYQIYIVSESDPEGMLWSNERYSLRGVLDQIERLTNPASEDNAFRVPDAPFKKTWHEMALRRMLRYAAENGYDTLAWTTGAQQADRYDLSKRVNSLHWSRLNERYIIKVKVGEESGLRDVAENITEDKLADYVGKELAQKIINLKGKKWTGVFEGVDLKVGGEGMKGFYDQILPAYLNKYAKKWGVTVGTTKLEVGYERRYVGPTYSAEELTSGLKALYSGPGDLKVSPFTKQRLDFPINTVTYAKQLRDVITNYEVNDQNDATFRQLVSFYGGLGMAKILGGNMERIPELDSVHTLPITERMRQSVMEGQPLFSPVQTKTPEFKAWFGKSKVVNPDGSPKEMYHGSSHDFTVFDKAKIRPYDYDAEFNGFWFSDDPATGPAMRDARYRKAVYLKMENPAPVDVWRALLREASRQLETYKGKGARTEHDAMRLLLQDRGYDGIFFDKPPVINKDELERTGKTRFKTVRGHEYEMRKEDGGYELYDYNQFHPEYSSHVTGYETVEQFLEQSETIAVVFEPTQIKSTNANVGTFDVNNPDINFAPRPAPTFAVDQPGRLDRIIRTLQDKSIDIKRVVESVQKAGLAIPDELNPVLKEEMYMKRAEQRASDFTNDELRPLLDRLRLAKISLETFDSYLHARHIVTDDVNAKLQAINPDLVGTPEYDKLAGMTDQEAQQIVAQAPPILPKIATQVDAIVEKTRDLMVAYGLETQARVDEWRQTYKNYVPLHREGFEEAGHPTGTGRSVRGSTVKSRIGSGLEVTNVLANVAQARDQIITRGEKQRPVIAMAGLLMLHPNPDIATLDKPAQITMTDPVTGLPVTVPGNLTNYSVPTVRRFDPVSRTVKTYPDPMYKGRDNVVNFRVDGKDYAIVFNERNERAMEVAKAFKELDTPKLNGVMAAIAPYTRYLASINTQYNPIFGIVNFVRDAQYAMLALGSTPLAGKKTTVLRHATRSLAGIYQDARAVRLGQHPTSSTARMWERFQHVGGPTGYRDLFFSSTDRADEIRRMMDPNRLANISSPQKLGKRLEETWLLKVLSDYNTTMENAIRLGVFTAAVEQGISDIQAASYAKNITVNFNKKGQIGAQMGSLFAFFNANVQGTARILETLFEQSPSGARLTAIGKKIVAGGILTGILQTFALTMAGFGDEEPPEYIKARNLIIPMPWSDKGYGMIPMPLGFNLLPNIGRAAAEAVRAGIEGKDINPLERAVNLFGAIYGTFSPLGGTGGVIQELMPTVADPFAAVASNKDWTGKSISKEDLSSLDRTPGHTRTRDIASLWATLLSKGINWATGGNEYRAGVYSPTPDTIDYLLEQVTGGIGRELSKGSQVVQSLMTGEELPFYKVPLLGRFAGSASGATSVRSTFYDNVRSVNEAYREFEGRAKDRTGDAHEFLRTHPEGRLRESAISIERTIGELNKVKKDLVKEGAPRSAIAFRETQITGLMKRFNEMVAQSRSQ